MVKVYRVDVSLLHENQKRETDTKLRVLSHMVLNQRDQKENWFR